MSKYVKKIYEIAPADATIHEVLRRPVRSKLFTFIDFWMEGVTSLADSFSTDGAFFLLTAENKAELVNITRDLDVIRSDVTDAVGASAGKRSFEHDGYVYKIYRKLR